MIDKSPLSSGERELIASYVSHLNDCEFCHQSHTAAANVHFGDTCETVSCVIENLETAKVPAKMKSQLKIAEKVQKSGKLVTSQDIDEAKSHGANVKKFIIRRMFRLSFTLLLTSVFFFSTALAQSPDTVFIRQDHNYDDTLIYVTDTVIFESGMTKSILMGTTILPSTHNQMMARGYGLYFSKVTKSDCQRNSNEKWNPDKINSITTTDSTLTVDINIIDNCCY